MELEPVLLRYRPGEERRGEDDEDMQRENDA